MANIVAMNINDAKKSLKIFKNIVFSILTNTKKKCVGVVDRR